MRIMGIIRQSVDVDKFYLDYGRRRNHYPSTVAVVRCVTILDALDLTGGVVMVAGL